MDEIVTSWFLWRKGEVVGARMGTTSTCEPCGSAVPGAGGLFGFASDPDNFTTLGSSTERRMSNALMLQRWICADKTAYSHGIGEH